MCDWVLHGSLHIITFNYYFHYYFNWFYQNHYQDCPKYPQQCDKCGKENIPREKASFFGQLYIVITVENGDLNPFPCESVGLKIQWKKCQISFVLNIARKKRKKIYEIHKSKQLVQHKYR